MKLQKSLKKMIFFLVNYYLVTFGIVTDRQTDGQTDRRKVMHKSPLCISTEGLKNLWGQVRISFAFFTPLGT